MIQQKLSFTISGNIGDGTSPMVGRKPGEDAIWIKIPDDLLIMTDGNKLHAMIESIYCDFASCYSDEVYLRERAIVTPTNDVADEINYEVMKNGTFTGEGIFEL